MRCGAAFCAALTSQGRTHRTAPPTGNRSRRQSRSAPMRPHCKVIPAGMVAQHCKASLWPCVGGSSALELLQDSSTTAHCSGSVQYIAHWITDHCLPIGSGYAPAPAPRLHRLANVPSAHVCCFVFDRPAGVEAYVAQHNLRPLLREAVHAAIAVGPHGAYSDAPFEQMVPALPHTPATHAGNGNTRVCVHLRTRV